MEANIEQESDNFMPSFGVFASLVRTTINDKNEDSPKHDLTREPSFADPFVGASLVNDNFFEEALKSQKGA